MLSHWTWAELIENVMIGRGNLTAFLNWATRNRFVATGLGINKVRVAQKPVTALSPDQVCDLLTAVSECSTLRLKTL